MNLINHKVRAVADKYIFQCVILNQILWHNISWARAKKKLKKISRRAQERVLQTLGTHTGTADPDFEATVHRVENLEKNLNNMFGAMNEYLKAMEAMQTASVNMATSFSLVIGEEHEELVRRQVANDES